MGNELNHLVGRSYEEIKKALNDPLKDDLVNHPPHYTKGGVECIDAISAALTAEEFRGFCKGNALKYIWREQLKGKTEDVRKAQFYLNRLVQEGK